MVLQYSLFAILKKQACLLIVTLSNIFQRFQNHKTENKLFLKIVEQQLSIATKSMDNKINHLDDMFLEIDEKLNELIKRKSSIK